LSVEVTVLLVLLGCLGSNGWPQSSVWFSVKLNFVLTKLVYYRYTKSYAHCTLYFFFFSLLFFSFFFFLLFLLFLRLSSFSFSSLSFFFLLLILLSSFATFSSFFFLLLSSSFSSSFFFFLLLSSSFSSFFFFYFFFFFLLIFLIFPLLSSSVFFFFLFFFFFFFFWHYNPTWVLVFCTRSFEAFLSFTPIYSAPVSQFFFLYLWVKTNCCFMSDRYNEVQKSWYKYRDTVKSSDFDIHVVKWVAGGTHLPPCLHLWYLFVPPWQRSVKQTVAEHLCSVSTEVVKVVAFWNVITYTLVGRQQCFEGNCCLRFQGRNHLSTKLHVKDNPRTRLCWKLNTEIYFIFRSYKLGFSVSWNCLLIYSFINDYRVLELLIHE
jgi:hypothetical protein